MGYGDRHRNYENISTKAKDIFKNQDYSMLSCYKKINKEDAKNPNLVKVILNQNNDALYFSRAKIPYSRDDKECEYFGHLGIYAYSAKSLKEFCNFEISNLEQIEKLEQLRALDNGKKIAMIEVNSKSIGIDTPEDLKKALKEFS